MVQSGGSGTDGPGPSTKRSLNEGLYVPTKIKAGWNTNSVFCRNKMCVIVRMENLTNSLMDMNRLINLITLELNDYSSLCKVRIITGLSFK